ncbi:MAG: Gfo/Idh/MocA family oxidoreductase [Dechloromonas sp.]|nr:MAG: Gfo/Idh/MocA family oxidoreductase [Dechloromonas sp.]
MALKDRIVVVGLGSIGRRHARLLTARGDLQVEWCESSTDAVLAAQQELGAPNVVHNSFEAMLASRPTMVVIATPHSMHAAQAIAALDMGIHVLCEKPLSDTLESARSIADAASRSSATLTVGFQLHFHPALCRVKHMIDTGDLGSVHHLHCLVGTYVTLVNSKSRYQSQIEGALFMDYAHQPDLFYWLIGRKPRGVYASGGQGGHLPLQANPNFAAITCDYDDSMISTIHLNYLQVPDRHEYEIIGDRGWISLDMFRGELRFGRRADASVQVETFASERDPLYRDEHQAFLEAIAGKRSPESSAGDALTSMEVIAASLTSFRSGCRVAL